MLIADDLILISPTVSGAQKMLNICSLFGSMNDIVFNPDKTVCMAVANTKHITGTLYISNKPIPWVSSLKYLGVHFVAKKGLMVDITSLKRSFYAACNSILVQCRYMIETVQVQLVRSYCLPLLLYCVGALDLNSTSIRDVSVCWNDAFRKIFKYNRWESVKMVQYFCGVLDFTHYYHMHRWKFLHSLGNKVPYFKEFAELVELERHYCDHLEGTYSSKTHSFEAAVYRHFESIVVDRM